MRLGACFCWREEVRRKDSPRKHLGPETKADSVAEEPVWWGKGAYYCSYFWGILHPTKTGVRKLNFFSVSNSTPENQLELFRFFDCSFTIGIAAQHSSYFSASTYIFVIIFLRSYRLSTLHFWIPKPTRRRPGRCCLEWARRILFCHFQGGI